MYLVPTPNAESIPLNLPMAAFGCALFIAGGLLYWTVSHRSPNARTNRWFSWLAVSLGASFLFASLMPLLVDVAGKVGGITITAAGGAALLLILLFGGWSKILQVMDKDDLSQTNTALKEELSKRAAEIATLMKRDDALHPGDRHVFSLNANRNKRITIVTGRIQDLNDVDVWVNSENTNMYMARVTEHSVSATIRFLGAVRNGQLVVQDLIADELSQTMGNKTAVAPGDVIPTKAGVLETSHNVKRIFHVAAAEGTPGYGFRPVVNIEDCVGNALRMASSPECADLNLRSIVFPLLGTGTAGGNVSDIVEKLLNQAVAFLAKNSDSPIEEAFFLALTQYQLAVCLEVMRKLPVRQESGPANN